MSGVGGGGENETWLPNLVGGVSIWKLARDLNEPKFFDGRLLVPETEGSDSLPTRVSWDVVGLVPLAEARAKQPAEVDGAIADFVRRLEKVAAEFADPASGYHEFKAAFTVPGIDADGGAHYFYDPVGKRLCAINWGASPRNLGGTSALVFGYRDFAKVAGTAVAAGAVEAGAATPAAKAPSAVSEQASAPADAAKSEEEKKKDDAKKKAEEEKKKEKKPAALLWGRPWWQWLLVLFVAVGLIALIAWLLRDCHEPPFGKPLAPEGGGAVADGAKGGGDAGGTGVAARDGAAREGASSADGAKEGGSARDGARDGARDAARDGARDGARDAKGGRDGGDGGASAEAGGSASGSGAGAGVGGSGAGSGVGGSGAGVGVGVGGTGGTGAPDPNALPHRFHFEPDAVEWRVAAGQNLLDKSSPLAGTGQNFEVILKPGGSFDGIKVEWRDRSGRWHR